MQGLSFEEKLKRFSSLYEIGGHNSLKTYLQIECIYLPSINSMVDIASRALFLRATSYRLGENIYIMFLDSGVRVISRKKRHAQVHV